MTEMNGRGGSSKPGRPWDCRKTLSLRVRRINASPEKHTAFGGPLNYEESNYPVRIYTLGVFMIERDGKPLVFRGKLQQKPLNMLKGIIAGGAKGVHDEQLIDILWPEAEGDAAHNAFKMALSRLRRLIGSNEAVRFHKGLVMLDSSRCWVDAWVFEQMASGVENHRRGRQRPSLRSVEKMGKAFDLYKGKFLPADTAQVWTVYTRARLRRRFLRLVCALAAYCEDSGNIEEAAECFERALDIESMTEEFYQHLMACYQKLGRNAEAVAVYRRCREALDAGLGISPSTKTEALYLALISGRR